jgi:hypothetical protein
MTNGRISQTLAGQPASQPACRHRIQTEILAKFNARKALARGSASIDEPRSRHGMADFALEPLRIGKAKCGEHVGTRTSCLRSRVAFFR